MEEVNLVETFGWLSALLVLALGVALGMVVSHYAGPSARKLRDLEIELTQARREHERYRKEVTEHFSQTGELVNQMTRSYRAVYEHLAKGAHRLTATELVTSRLQFNSEQIPILGVGDQKLPSMAAKVAASKRHKNAGQQAGAPAPSTAEPAVEETQPPRDYPVKRGVESAADKAGSGEPAVPAH